VWALSTLTGEIRKLADDGWLAAFSPDARQVAMIRGSNGDIVVMGANGENARTAAHAGAGFGFWGVDWSPDGRRLACLRVATANMMSSSIEVLDLAGGRPQTVVAHPRVIAFDWTSDGRLIYTQSEAPAKQEVSGLWELQLDSRTGQPRGEPRQLATWLSQGMLSLSASRDGTRVLVTKGRTRSNVYLGQLNASGDGFTDVRQLTRDDQANWPSGWTPDGRAVLFHSDRNGNFDLFRQGPSDREARPLLLGPDEVRGARLSPDGRWVLYLSMAGTAEDTGLARMRLMRMPVGGGPSAVVLETAGNWGRGEGAANVDGEYNWSFPIFRCPSVGTAPCIVGEAAGPGQTVFSAFDPATGRKGELARIDLPAAWVAWDLSPDGTRIAFVTYGFTSFTKAPVRVLTLSTKTVREIVPKDWSPTWQNLNGVAWSASGNDMFVTNFAVRGGTLVNLDLAGRVRVLLDFLGKGRFIVSPQVSPDGRSLAFSQATVGSNAWVFQQPQ
jgi:WD40 repeat protein